MSAVQPTERQSTRDGARVLVAAVAAALATLAASSQTGGAEALIAGFSAAVVVVLAAVDLRERRIPNRIVLPATALVLAARLLLWVHPGPCLLAALAAGGGLLLLNLVTRSGIGMGDVKLVTFMGATLGTGVLAALMIASLTLLPVAVIVVIRGGLSARKTWLPFGPFLALGTLIVLIAGHAG